MKCLMETYTIGDSVSKWTPDSHVHPEELGEYAEGDILHPEDQGRNGLRAKSSRWPNRTIPYEISPYIRTYDLNSLFLYRHVN